MLSRHFRRIKQLVPTLSVELGSLECCNPEVAAYRHPLHPLQPQYRTTNDAVDFVSSHPTPRVRKPNSHLDRTIFMQGEPVPITLHSSSTVSPFPPTWTVSQDSPGTRSVPSLHEEDRALWITQSYLRASDHFPNCWRLASDNNGFGRVALNGSRLCGRGWLTIVL